MEDMSLHATDKETYFFSYDLVLYVISALSRNLGTHYTL